MGPSDADDHHDDDESQRGVDLRGSSAVQVGENPQMHIHLLPWSGGTRRHRISTATRQFGRLTRAGVRRARDRPRITVTVAALVTVLVVISALALRTGNTPNDTQLARIPQPLRSSCHFASAAAGFTGATTVLACPAGDRTVNISLFDQQTTYVTAYADAVRSSGVATGTGDCTNAIGAEHRYPPTGSTTGRVMCYTHYGETDFVWTDDHALTIAHATGPDHDSLALTHAWMSWVRWPDYPTRAEQQLIDLVALPNCRRVPPGNFDAYQGVLAAIDCDPRELDAGAQKISYYQFADIDALTRAYNGDVAAAHAPTWAYCSDPSFLASEPMNIHGTDIGHELCHRDQHNVATIEWTMEPLLVTAQATGPDSTKLTNWWDYYFGHGPPTERLIQAADSRATPPFPTTAERTLLDRIPEPSRIDCSRPSQNQIEQNVGKAPVVAIACGPIPDVPIVFRYQFNDAAAMNAAYQGTGPGPDCTTLPANSAGDAPYTKNGDTGHLRCNINTGGKLFLIWTSDRTNVLTMAFGGDLAKMIDWWRTQAGPN